MKTYEIRMKSNDSITILSKKKTLEYIGKNKDDIIGIYILKNDVLYSFITNDDILSGDYVFLL